MLSNSIKALFLEFIDETDITFQSDASTDMFLDLGYNAYRNIIWATDPDIMTYQADFNWGSLSTNNQLDLSDIAAIPGLITIPNGFDNTAPFAPIMGMNAMSGERLLNLRKIVAISAVGAEDGRLFNLRNSKTDFDYSDANFSLEGTLLKSNTDTSFIRLYYMAEPPTNIWGFSTFIDDLSQFHAIIALFAARYYAIKDGGINDQLEAKTKSMEAEFRAWLQAGRTTGANRTVTY